MGTGHLDEPRDGAVVERGPLTVSGWAVLPSSPTSRVEVRLGERSLGLAQLGVGRPDVAAAHGAAAALSGFSLTADLTGWPGADGPMEVRVVASNVAGEHHELPPATIELASAPSPEQAPPAVGRRAGGAKNGLRTLVCTHQLCLGGASRYLLELLGELLRLEAVDPVVLSPIGGPLQPELEALGIPVHVSGRPPLDDGAAHDGRVEEVLAWAAPQGFELALVNTASALNVCGATVAGQLGIPVVWAIHESFEPTVLWSDCSPGVRRRGEEALAGAALAVFEADATRRIYEPYLADRSLTLPYGFDLAPIDALRSGFDRSATRRRLGIPPGADLVLCVGTIEPRKAQASLAQAFDLIADRHPYARLALVGAGDTADSRALSEWSASAASAERIRLVPTTPDVQQWYGASNLLVCPSRIESLPRVAIEGMAWEMPVLATDVFGLPELIDHGMTGWLCEAGDTGVLAEALDRALSAGQDERRRIGRAGRELVERRHALAPYGREIARLLGAAVKGTLSEEAPAPAGAAAPRPGSRRG